MCHLEVSHAVLCTSDLQRTLTSPPSSKNSNTFAMSPSFTEVWMSTLNGFGGAAMTLEGAHGGSCKVGELSRRGVFEVLEFFRIREFGRPLRSPDKIASHSEQGKGTGAQSRREQNAHACLVGIIAELKAAAMSAPAADDEVGRMSAVSSESDAPVKGHGRGKGAVKDRAAAAAGSEGEGGGSNSGGGESSDGGGESSDGEEVRGRYFDVLSCAPSRVLCVRLGAAGENTRPEPSATGLQGFPLFVLPATPKDRPSRKAGTVCSRVLLSLSVASTAVRAAGHFGLAEGKQILYIHRPLFRNIIYGTQRERWKSAPKLQRKAGWVLPFGLL